MREGEGEGGGGRGRALPRVEQLPLLLALVLVADRVGSRPHRERAEVAPHLPVRERMSHDISLWSRGQIFVAHQREGVLWLPLETGGPARLLGLLDGLDASGVIRCARSPSGNPGGPTGRWGHGGQAWSIMHKRPTESELTSTYSMGKPVSACTSNIMPQNLRGRASQAARRSSRAGGGTEWLLAHVWSSWSLVSQVKLSWTRSLCTASSWSTPSKGAALAMLGTIGDAARTILVGDEPSIRSAGQPETYSGRHKTLASRTAALLERNRPLR